MQEDHNTNANADTNVNSIKNIKNEVVKTKKRRFNRKHLSILPNGCTSLNLFCGYLAIIMTSQGEFLVAAWLILVANIFDILDGRLARLTSVSSKFGAELDSLSDLISFGVAPAFLIFHRYLSANTIFGIVVTSIYVLCGALRLARFNVTPHSKKDVFVGLPIPAAAGILSTMTIFELQFFSFLKIPSSIIPIVVIIASFLMVSNVEYPAMKKTEKTSRMRLFLVIFLLLALVIAPPITLFFLSWGFALYGLVYHVMKTVLGFLKGNKIPKKEIKET